MTRRRPRLVTTAVLFGAVVGVIAVWRPWQEPEPPFTAAELDIRATPLEFVTNDEAEAIFGDDTVYADAGDQLVLGQVSWETPPKPLGDGTFWIVLLDEASERRPAYISSSSPEGPASNASDSVLTEVEERYPWLNGIGAVEIDGGVTDVGTSLSVHDENASPLTFAGLFVAPDGASPEPLAPALAPVDISDLLVAMVYIGPDREVYWAERLIG